MMEDINKLMEALRSDRARELIKAGKEPANEEEAVDLYLNVMNECGVTVSRESVVRFLTLREKKYQEESAKAESAVKEALKDTDLEAVSGGEGDEGLPYSTCEASYHPGEWCWLNDSCSYVITDYSGEDNASIPYDLWDLGGTRVDRGGGWYEYEDY